MIEFIYLKQPPCRYTMEKAPKLKEWIVSKIKKYNCENLLNLFAGKTIISDGSFKEIRIDLDKEMPLLDENIDADIYIDKCIQNNVKYDCLLLDPPFCYDDKTEIFTENGWINIKEFVENTDNRKVKIATLNSKTDTLEYKRPDKLLSFNYNGDMIKFESKYIDLFVTPDHNLYISSCHNKNFRFTKAKDICKGIKFKKNCNWVGKNTEYFKLPKVDYISANKYGMKFAPEKEILMKDWLRFFGLWIAEGSLKNRLRKERKTKSEYKVVITQKKEKNLPIIEEWIRNIGYRFYRDDIHYCIHDKQLYTYLKQFGHCKDKFIPKDIKNLNSNYLEYLIEGLMLGDGCKSFDSRYLDRKYDSCDSYSTSSWKLANDFNEIILKTNKSCLLKETKGIKNIGKHTFNYIIYNIGIVKRNNYPCIQYNKLNKYLSKENFNGKIYCVEAPNNIIYIRRNNKSIWCGNSLRKSREKYQGRYIGCYTKLKNKLPLLLNKNGIIIEFGFTAMGMSNSRGFELKDLCIVAHGGDHSATIITVETLK